LRLLDKKGLNVLGLVNILGTSRRGMITDLVIYVVTIITIKNIQTYMIPGTCYCRKEFFIKKTYWIEVESLG